MKGLKLYWNIVAKTILWNREHKKSFLFIKLIIMFGERQINGKQRKIHPLGGPN